MARVRDLPLGDKLVVVGVAASALALIVSSLIFLFSNYVALRQDVRDEIRLRAEIVAENAAAEVAFREVATATSTLGSFRLSDDVDVACIFDDTGDLFASYILPGSNGACPSAMPADGEVLDRGIAITTPIVMQARRLGSLYLHGTFRDLWSQMADQAAASLAGIGLGVIMAVLLSRRVQRIISEPIGELSATAQKISRAGDYSLRASKRGDDEIGQLVDTFNGMVAEVERRDDQLRAASRMKDEFLAALSHELRTPLNAVLGWIQVLRTTPADAVTTARAYESIERNARAQASLIEDLLDISRIVSGKLHFKSESVDLIAVIDAALEVVRPSADAKDIRIDRRVLAGPGPQVVVGDAHRLQQIAWNLLSNAIKFTGKGGTVVISLSVHAGDYRLEVRDNGSGIRPEFLPHVFDRFRQADGSITRRHGGLGLGLAIARELTELHGGSIQAASDGENQGATFAVVLPKPLDRAHVRIDGGNAAHDSLAGLAILVVDDDRDTRELATAVLAAAGAAIQTVSSAEDALRLLGTRRFDVLICDLAMPGVDGYELMRLIRDNPHMPHSQTPAIAVSAHAGAAAESRARASGFDAFVSKPYDLAALFAAVRRVRKQAVAP